MSKVIMKLDSLRQNIQTVDKWLSSTDASWTMVTKIFCGHKESLLALASIGVRSMADSRLRNLAEIDEEVPDVEQWYLRIPSISSVSEVVSLSDVSLNSEIEVIEELSRAAKEQNKQHKIIIMIELGDLREGILPGSLVSFYKRAFDLPNIETIGIGSNLGCISGAIPSVDQFMQLVLYKELLELKFKRPLPLISAGSSSSLPMLCDRQLPKDINHFRIGESIFLGNNLTTGEMFPELRSDVFTIEAEIIEIKKKGLVPYGETSLGTTPFSPITADDVVPGERGFRAVVNLGQLDTEVAGLTPLNNSHTISGASSDVMIVNVGDDGEDLHIGNAIKFRPSYAALARAMNCRYLDKEIIPLAEQLNNDNEASKTSLQSNFTNEL